MEKLTPFSKIAVYLHNIHAKVAKEVKETKLPTLTPEKATEILEKLSDSKKPT